MRVAVLLFVLVCLAGCAAADGEPTTPDIRVSGTWQGGISHEKGFKR